MELAKYDQRLGANDASDFGSRLGSADPDDAQSKKSESTCKFLVQIYSDPNRVLK